MALGLLTRFVYGFGAGLIRSVIIIARAQSKKGKKELQAKDYFRWHMQAEALGYFLGPFILVITFHTKGKNEQAALYLAIAQATIWLIFVLSFSENVSQASEAIRASITTRDWNNSSEGSQSEVNNTARSGRHEADDFIKALLYNQVPMTSFFNRRTMLALFALLSGFLLITFIWPFFALIKGRKSFEVAV